jgi:hypothetical protein
MDKSLDEISTDAIFAENAITFEYRGTSVTIHTAFAHRVLLENFMSVKIISRDIFVSSRNSAADFVRANFWAVTPRPAVCLTG